VAAHHGQLAYFALGRHHAPVQGRSPGNCHLLY
jgi:hypothetical protein